MGPMDGSFEGPGTLVYDIEVAGFPWEELNRLDDFKSAVGV